jgi:hypothetical protein
MPGPTRVLILGWNDYVLDGCQAAGLAATLVCSPGLLFSPGEVDPGLYEHLLIVDDHTDIGDVLMALTRRGLGDVQFDGVYTSEDPIVVHAAVLAQTLGIRGPSVETAVRFRDKVVQKRYIASAGIATPRAVAVESLDDAAAAADGLAYPLVLKPVAGMMAYAVRVVRSAAELAVAVEALRHREPHLLNYVLEEFVEGDEWHCDGFVESGEVRFLSVGAYAEPARQAIEGRSKRAVILDPWRQAGAYDVALPLTTRALQALGMSSGVFHLEAFVRPDGTLVFGECAARAGGAIIVPTVREKFGVDLHEVGLRLACGLDAGAEVRADVAAVGYVQLPMPPGRLVAPPDRREVEALPGVVHANLNMKPGYRMPEDRPHSSFRVGEAILRAADEGALRRQLDGVANWTMAQVEVEAGH